MLAYMVIVVSFFEATTGLSLPKETCLGIKGACDLRLDEVTLAGAHNAGAGFAGHLYYHNPYLIALSCAYRNQYQLADMLNDGVRFFDLDLCYEGRSGYERGVWACHKDAYGGPMSRFLMELDHWLNEPQNKREIVVLHFNKEHEKGEKEGLIGRTIIRDLEDLWNPLSSYIKGKLVMQTDINASIGSSIKENKRIFIFMSGRLLGDKNKPFLFDDEMMGYTGYSQGWLGSDNCKKLATKVADRCLYQAYKKFVRLDLYLTWGKCVHDLANDCNKQISFATRRCDKWIRSKSDRAASTVNFIVVDYASAKPGKDSIIMARKMTQVYIESKYGITKR